MIVVKKFGECANKVLPTGTKMSVGRLVRKGITSAHRAQEWGATLTSLFQQTVAHSKYYSQMPGYFMPPGPEYFPQHFVSKNKLCSSFGVRDKAFCPYKTCILHLRILCHNIFVFIYTLTQQSNKQLTSTYETT
jgi:hypothetical protein